MSHIAHMLMKHCCVLILPLPRKGNHLQWLPWIGNCS